jgi:sulfur carrier protein
MIDIVVNGQPKSVESNLSVARLLAALGLSSKSVIIEYNGAVSKPAELMDTMLKQNDKLEIIQMVGGG